MSAIFQSRERTPELTARRDELNKARRALDAFGPDYSRDVEHAYKADPPLAHEAASARVQRAVQAMRLKLNCVSMLPHARERFASKWKELDAQRGNAYRQGYMMGMKRIHDSMGAMAKGLGRDAQLESVKPIYSLRVHLPALSPGHGCANSRDVTSKRSSNR